MVLTRIAQWFSSDLWSELEGLRDQGRDCESSLKARPRAGTGLQQRGPVCCGHSPSLSSSRVLGAGVPPPVGVNFSRAGTLTIIVPGVWRCFWSRVSTEHCLTSSPKVTAGDSGLPGGGACH